jgi:hypothetical protein
MGAGDDSDSPPAPQPLPHVFHKRSPHVVELIEQHPVDIIHVAKRARDIEASPRLTR